MASTHAIAHRMRLVNRFVFVDGLVIYVGYLKRKLLGGILAGLTFLIPGAVMIILSWLYVTYGSLPQVITSSYSHRAFSPVIKVEMGCAPKVRPRNKVVKR